MIFKTLTITMLVFCFMSSIHAQELYSENQIDSILKVLNIYRNEVRKLSRKIEILENEHDAMKIYPGKIISHGRYHTTMGIISLILSTGTMTGVLINGGKHDFSPAHNISLLTCIPAIGFSVIEIGTGKKLRECTLPYKNKELGPQKIIAAITVPAITATLLIVISTTIMEF